MASRKDWRFYNRDVVHAKKVMDTHIAWIKSGEINPNSATEYQNSIIASERFGAEIFRNSQRKPQTLGPLNGNTDQEVIECVKNKRAQGQLNIDFP